MKLLATILLFILTNVLFSQSKKDLKDGGIIARTEKTSKLEKKVLVTFVESEEKYDENGNKIELIEYKSNGDIKTFDQFSYNEKGRLSKETHLDPLTKKAKETVEYFYNDDDKVVKETYYNKKGELHKTVDYTYENKLKIEKKITNSSGKTIETKSYTYQKK
jgi:hypothetical protein